SGNTARARLINLQKTYDDHVNQRILTGTSETSQIRIHTDDIQAALDEKTVLAYYYVCARQGRVALRVMLITREDVTGACIGLPFPVSAFQMEWKGQRFVTDLIGVTISQFRDALLEPPGSRLVSKK